MARYVDCEKAREMFNRYFNNLQGSEAQILVCDMKQAFLELPTADVAPVVHGRWIDKGEYAVCMECGGRSSTQYNGVEPIPLMTQFCPHCGAKMDGGEQE